MEIKKRIKELVPDAGEDFGLAVVLRAIEKHNFQTDNRFCLLAISVYGEFYYSSDNPIVLGRWDLTKDYDQQSEECKQFIGGLLGVK